MVSSRLRELYSIKRVAGNSSLPTLPVNSWQSFKSRFRHHLFQEVFLEPHPNPDLPISKLVVYVGLVGQTRNNGWKLQEDRVHPNTKMSIPILCFSIHHWKCGAGVNRWIWNQRDPEFKSWLSSLPTRVTLSEYLQPSEQQFPQLKNNSLSEDGTKDHTALASLALSIWSEHANFL